jgi:hypothetical protein
MKRPTLATRAIDAKELGSQGQQKHRSDALDLSPERISEGVTARTEVLTQILEREQRLHHFRHWGINE